MRNVGSGAQNLEAPHFYKSFFFFLPLITYFHVNIIYRFIGSVIIP